jgi:hypothetical protein
VIADEIERRIRIVRGGLTPGLEPSHD